MILTRTVSNYSSALLSELHQHILNFVNYDLSTNRKKLKQLCLPSDGFELINRKQLSALMKDFSLNCSASYDYERNIIEEHNISEGYEKIKDIIFSATYLNIIKLKKIENYPQLEQLYITSFLLKYNSKIPLNKRTEHAFDETKYKEFCRELKLNFIKGISLNKERDNGPTTFNGMHMQDDMSTLCWLFWRYCTIKALFDNIDENDKFDLIRILHSDIEAAKEFRRVLDFNKRDPAQLVLKKFASAGGKAKAESYQTKMNPIFDEVFSLFQKPNPTTKKQWKSKGECAKYFIKEFYLKNPDTDIDLDPKKLVSEITNRINEHSASKMVKVLANR